MACIHDTVYVRAPAYHQREVRTLESLTAKVCFSLGGFSLGKV